MQRIFLLPFMALVLLVACSPVSGEAPSKSAVSPAGQETSVGTTRGPIDAPVTLLIYSDFQCPACAQAGPIIEEMLKAYPGKIYVVYRYYPLAAHRHSLTAAIAAECAKEQGRFWDYHDLLFSKQNEWGKSDLPIALYEPANPFSGYAKELGLDTQAFDRCIRSPKTRGAIDEARKEGDMFRIMSTPTFFINNQRVVGILSLKARYKELIDAALKQK